MVKIWEDLIVNHHSSVRLYEGKIPPTHPNSRFRTQYYGIVWYVFMKSLPYKEFDVYLY